MRISTIGYSMKQGVKNIRRNKMFSIASIATMAACIFLFGLFYSIVVNFNYIVEKAEEGVAITVFFNEDTTPVSYTHLDVYKRQIYVRRKSRYMSKLWITRPEVRHLTWLHCIMAYNYSLWSIWMQQSNFRKSAIRIRR